MYDDFSSVCTKHDDTVNVVNLPLCNVNITENDVIRTTAINKCRYSSAVCENSI